MSNTPIRFESRYIKLSCGCWIWLGPATQRVRGEGYGRYRNDYAHREAYIRYVGEIPEGMFVLHHCDITLCVNPEHLYLGTAQDNMRDRCERNRFGADWQRTRINHGR